MKKFYDLFKITIFLLTLFISFSAFSQDCSINVENGDPYIGGSVEFDVDGINTDDGDHYWITQTTGSVSLSNPGDSNDEVEDFTTTITGCGTLTVIYERWNNSNTTLLETCSETYEVAECYDFCTSCNGNGSSCDYPSIGSNPDLTAQCSDIQIALVIDESGSIDDPVDYSGEVEDGTMRFLNSLRCTEATVAIIEFSYLGNYVQESYREVDDDYIADMEDYFDGTGFNGQEYDPDGGTNWHDAFTRVDELSEAPDLLIFFSDGVPTAWFDPDEENSNPIPDGYNNCGNGTTTQRPEIVNPMKIANQLKQNGTHIFGLGIGSDPNLQTNMMRISGNVEFDPGAMSGEASSISTADFYANSNFEALAASLREFADQLCPAVTICSSLTVDQSKIEIQIDNTQVNPGTQVQVDWENETLPASGSTSVVSTGGIQTITITNGAPFNYGIYVVTVSTNVGASNCLKVDECEFDFNSALPIELINFNAELVGCQAHLSWKTATEINNAKFVIERSNDGQYFESIGEVDGYGDSHIERNYSFTDTIPENDKHYYRLTQIDFDGSFERFKIAEVDFSECKTSNQIQVYATAGDNNAMISLSDQLVSEGAFIHVLSIDGRQVDVIDVGNRNQIDFDMSSLSHGVYIIYAITEKGTRSEVTKIIR